MYSALLLISATLSMAMPVDKRAGGPAITPIPANCTILNPLPHSTCTTGAVSGYKLSEEFNSTNVIYQAYYDSTSSPEDTWTQCIEQCYGYGTPGTCKLALLAYNVTVPAGYYGTEGGNLSPTACLMYSGYASPDDFEIAPSGQFVQETAGNIYCGY